jgi:hypothetical protein
MTVRLGQNRLYGNLICTLQLSIFGISFWDLGDWIQEKSLEMTSLYVCFPVSLTQRRVGLRLGFSKILRNLRKFYGKI